MSNEEMSLVPYEPRQMGVVRPLVKPSEMLAAIKEYEALKTAIIQPKDIQIISGRQHIKKSGWLRIARAFGITVEPVREEYQVSAEDGTWGYAIVVRAVAPNGASMQGDGMCWSTEKNDKQRTRHNVRAHAYTRATNRAISNLVGGGEVSAEEMQDYREDDEPMATNASPRQTARTAPGKPMPTWPQLRQRGREAGIVDENEWVALLKRVTRKERGLADTDKMPVLLEVERLEREGRQFDFEFIPEDNSGEAIPSDVLATDPRVGKIGA